MLTWSEKLAWPESEWQEQYQKLQKSSSIVSLVITAWQIGLWFARWLVEQELEERAKRATVWGRCPLCGHRLESKGLVPRRLLTLVGWVQWRRRVGRCPHHCAGSQRAPLDRELGLLPDQKTSVEVMGLGCLLAVFLPFELAAWLLEQFSGIRVSKSTIWEWVQSWGQKAMNQLEQQLQLGSDGHPPQPEPLAEAIAALPLVIAADGVTVPFRPEAGTAKGKIIWREVKVALLSRLATQVNRAGQSFTRLRHRRLVAVLGDIDALQSRLHLEALRQGVETAPQVVWLSDGAWGFWRLFQQSFAHIAVGILDFYHAAGYLWQAAEAFGQTYPGRTPQKWFERLRHQLRHGYVHRIIKELGALLRYSSTPPAAQGILRRVRNYLKNHFSHLQYRLFKKQGLPIGSGMVESACKWLITQRFKGVGMRWSEPGFNHLLHLRLAWVNQRFEPLFSQEPLFLSLYSPNL